MQTIPYKILNHDHIRYCPGMVSMFGISKARCHSYMKCFQTISKYSKYGHLSFVQGFIPKKTGQMFPSMSCKRDYTSNSWKSAQTQLSSSLFMIPKFKVAQKTRFATVCQKKSSGLRLDSSPILFSWFSLLRHDSSHVLASCSDTCNSTIVCWRKERQAYF